MKTMIMSIKNINETFPKDLVLAPSEWDSIKNKLKELENNNLKELMQVTNKTISYFAKSILFERGAIRI